MRLCPLRVVCACRFLGISERFERLLNLFFSVLGLYFVMFLLVFFCGVSYRLLPRLHYRGSARGVTVFRTWHNRIFCPVEHCSVALFRLLPVVCLFF